MFEDAITPTTGPLNTVAADSRTELSPRDAAIAASLVGAGELLARLGVGYLLDLFAAPRVAVWLFSSSTVGLFSPWSGATGYLLFTAAFLVGVGQGANWILSRIW